MTKSDLVDAIAERAGITKRDAHAALEATLGAISDELAGGGAVTLTGFGTFKVGRGPPARASTRAPASRWRSPPPAFRGSRAGSSLKRHGQHARQGLARPVTPAPAPRAGASGGRTSLHIGRTSSVGVGPTARPPLGATRRLGRRHAASVSG